MEPDELDDQIRHTVRARGASAPAHPDYDRVRTRVAGRRRRHAVTAIVTGVVFVAGAAAWAVRDDSSPTTHVRIPPADTTARSQGAACGNPIAPPTKPSLNDTTWRAIPGAPTPCRTNPTRVWTGKDVVVVGGKLIPPGGGEGIPTATADAYEPRSRRWRTLPDAPFTPGESFTATWTGREVVIVSGNTTMPGVRITRAAAYDPERNAWRVLPDPPVADAGPTAVWTGAEVLLWGTPEGGAAYDPSNDRWRAIAPMPAGGPLGSVSGFASVWTGSEMVVWAGSNWNNAASREAAAYAPATDTWRVLPVSPRRPMFRPDAVWSGTELLAWGWSNVAPAGERADFGVAFDPSTTTWRELPDAPLGSPQSPNGVSPQLVWTGVHAVALDGGLDTDGPTLLRFDTTTNTWTKLPAPPIDFATDMVWAGDRLLVFGYPGTSSYELTD